MSQEDYLKDISEIKNLMNKSSKFISLSGLSGILAGIYALIGVCCFYLYSTTLVLSKFNKNDINLGVTILITVFVLSTLTTILFTSKRAKKVNEKSWDVKTKNLLEAFTTPVICGIILVFMLFIRNEYNYLLALLFVFYGLGLVNASFRTNNIVKPLGYLQIVSGLLSIQFSEYSFWCFAIGFGLIHLIYGSFIYLKYDKK